MSALLAPLLVFVAVGCAGQPLEAPSEVHSANTDCAIVTATWERRGSWLLAATPSHLVVQEKVFGNLRGYALPRGETFLTRAWPPSPYRGFRGDSTDIILHRPPAGTFVVEGDVLLVVDEDERNMVEVDASTGEFLNWFRDGRYFDIVEVEREYVRGDVTFRQEDDDVKASDGRMWPSTRLLACGESGLFLAETPIGEQLQTIAPDGSLGAPVSAPPSVWENGWLYSDENGVSELIYDDGRLRDPSTNRCLQVGGPPESVEATPWGFAVLVDESIKFFGFAEQRPAVATCRWPTPRKEWRPAEPIPTK